jgi:SAM-dependent methyltransferase
MQTVRGLGKIANSFRLVADAIDSLKGPPPTAPLRLNTTQRMFVEWTAARLKITKEEALKRYECSWSAIPGGHRSQDFRELNDTLYRLFGVFISDNPSELYAAYDFFSFVHFLRMASYDEPQWALDNPIMLDLLGSHKVDIVDFGCGLAQNSRSLAQALSRHGVAVEVHLADIPTIRKDFLTWMARQDQTTVSIKFLDCTPECPIPPLPDCDVCIAEEFFEHVYEPVKYLNSFDSVLRPGGFLLTNIADHSAEFMHVHPILADVRSRLHELRYEEIAPQRTFKKSSAKAVGRNENKQ